MGICLQTTAEHPVENLQSILEADISRDLWRMQQQPRIMDDYRRFVVIKGIGNRSTPPDEYEVCMHLTISVPHHEVDDNGFYRKSGVF